MVDGCARQSGDLGAQLVARATGGGSEIRCGTGFELGELLREPGPSVFEQRSGLRVGFSQQAGTLAGDVTLRLADLLCLGLRSDPIRLTGIELRLDLGSAGSHALLDRRTGELPQQEEHQQRGGDAEQQLVALRPELRRRLGDVFVLSTGGGNQRSAKTFT